MEEDYSEPEGVQKKTSDILNAVEIVEPSNVKNHINNTLSLPLSSALSSEKKETIQHNGAPSSTSEFAYINKPAIYFCSKTDLATSVNQPISNCKLSTNGEASQSKQRRTSAAVARRNIVKEFAEKCNLHGIYEIYHATALRRMFWLSAFCIALGVAVYECVVIVDNYRQSPVVVSYIVKEAREGLPIPDVFVCPFNRFDRLFVERNNISQELLQYIEFSFDDILKYKNLYDLQLNDSYADMAWSNALSDQLNQMLATLNLTYTDFISAASLSCLDIIPYCLNNVGKYNCCETAEESWFTVGKCFRIKGITQFGNGYGWGLSIVIRKPIDRYSPSVTNFHNDGFAIKLAESSRGLDYDLTFLPIGSHALMPLRATNFNFMNDPPRFTCVDRHTQSYSRQTCFDVCMSKEGEKSCKCARPGTLQPQLPLCTTNQTVTCVMDTARKIMSTTEDYLAYIYECREQCKPNCSYWQYTMSVSYANFPATTLQRYIEPEDWAQYLNTTILDIYYENLEYTVIQHHHSMTVDTFISNIGGQVGLWIGGSILTTLQVLVFLFQFLFGQNPTELNRSKRNIASRLTKKLKNSSDKKPGSIKFLLFQSNIPESALKNDKDKSSSLPNPANQHPEYMSSIDNCNNLMSLSQFQTSPAASMDAIQCKAKPECFLTSNPHGSLPTSSECHSGHFDGCNRYFLVPSTMCFQLSDGALCPAAPHTPTAYKLIQKHQLSEGSLDRSTLSLHSNTSRNITGIGNTCDMLLNARFDAAGDSNNNGCMNKNTRQNNYLGKCVEKSIHPNICPSYAINRGNFNSTSSKDSKCCNSNYQCNGSATIDTTINSYKDMNKFCHESLI